MASLTAKGCTELARWEQVDNKPRTELESFCILAVRTVFALRSDGALLRRIDLRERSFGKEQWRYGRFSIFAKRVKGFPDQTAVTAWMTTRGYQAVA